MGYNPADMGRRIATIRKKCGFSQFDLAEALYVSHSYISKIENGIREPSFAFMTAFSELTQTSLEYLIMGKKEAKDVKHCWEKQLPHYAIWKKNCKCKLVVPECWSRGLNCQAYPRVRHLRRNSKRRVVQIVPPS